MITKKQQNLILQPQFQSKSAIDVRPYGNYKLLINDYHKGEPLLTLGPNYIFFIVAFLTVNVMTILLLIELGKKEITRSFFLIELVTIFFLDTLWLSTALINPGIANNNTEELSKMCEDCFQNNSIQINKMTDRVHCKECDICIDEQMHHLRILGGCVGKNNFIVFKLLLLGIFIWGLSMITIVPQIYNL